jgi:hypothetical protein
MDHGRVLAAKNVLRPPRLRRRFFEIGAAFQAVIHDHILPRHCIDRFQHEEAGA